MRSRNLHYHPGFSSPRAVESNSSQTFGQTEGAHPDQWDRQVPIVNALDHDFLLVSDVLSLPQNGVFRSLTARIEGEAQVTENLDFTPVCDGESSRYTEATSRTPTRERISIAAPSGITTHLDAPRTPTTTVKTTPIGASRNKSPKSRVSGSFQGGRLGDGFNV